MVKRKLVVYVLTAFVVSVALATGVAYAVLRHYLAGEEARVFAAEDSVKLAPEVAKDLDELAGVPFMKELMASDGLTSAELDAGSVMNRRLPWQAGEGETAATDRALELPEAAVQQLQTWDRDWLDRAGGADLSGIDFGWMSELHSYRYWDLERTGPLADALKKDPQLDPIAFPGPNFDVVSAWVKLRLLSALQADGDPAAAFADVQHLAFLTMSTQTSVFTLVGLSYLAQLDKAAEVLRALGKLPDGWQPPLTLERIDMAKRALWGEAQYVDFAAPDAAIAQVFPADKTRPGRCAALDERLPSLQLTRAMLGPFYEERFTRLEALVSQLAAGCRPRQVLKLWHDPAFLPLPLKGNMFDMLSLGEIDEERGKTVTSGEGLTFAEVRRIPILRRALGLVLAGVAKPSFLGGYEAEKAAASGP